jgi:Fe-Mn family superoxide dismutase
MTAYTSREELKPKGLDGISDNQIEQHWALYKGYVTQTNALRDELAKMRAEGKSGEMAYADRRRRFGFEYNGMVLHEWYFGNLKAGVAAKAEGAFAKAVAEQFGSFDAWKADFAGTGKSRSIGWAICFFDPATGAINNHFVQLHEEGDIAGFLPLCVMDVWEHAYMVDFKATERPAYVDAFFKNVNWDVVEARFESAKAGKVPARF